LIENDLIDELVIYQAPHIMGSNTKPMFLTPKWESLQDRLSLDIQDIRKIGADYRITARPINR
jgi:diaminohydroxyphosphoribosylaminopyrimidine deaminase/5-amino-6-(5-phosphoribosylamino)uracil reductase